MKSTNRKERGQAIVMIALALVGLIAFTALAIDGGNAFADRRQAQNAADTAVLAAALDKVRNPDAGTWATIGANIAATNGYDNTNANQTVYIHSCDDFSVESCPSAYFGDDEYVRIKIESNVDTFFASVIGIDQVRNTVEAIARAKPPVEFFFGNAMVSLNESDPFTYELNGGIGALVTGGGILVNSDADCAFDVDGGSGLFELPEGDLTVVGTACDLDNPDININPGDQLPPEDYNFDYMDDLVDCGNAVSDSAAYRRTTNESNDTIVPPSNSAIRFTSKFPPSGIHYLDPGVYCLENAFNQIKANPDATEPDLLGTEVTFVLVSDNLTWTGNATVTLSAPTSGPTSGLLFYQPKSNTVDFSIGGGYIVNLTGMILAPGAEIKIAGNPGSLISGQVISDQITLSGDAGFQLHYDNSQNMDAPPQVELVR